LGKLNNTDRGFEIKQLCGHSVDGPVRLEKKKVGLTKLQGFEEHLEHRVSGNFSTLPTFYPEFEKCIRHTLPGTVTVICGGPGSGKSFFANQLILEFLFHGYRPALCALEENENFHTYRAMAQLSGTAKIMDPNWAENNPEAIRDIYRCYQTMLKEYLDHTLTIPNKKIVTYQDLLHWAKNRIRKEYDVIVIDPITAVTVQNRRDIEDAYFINELKGLMEASGKRAILVTHPKQQLNRVESLHNMAGGSAFERFVQCVLWLTRVDFNTDREVLQNGNFGTFNFNRTIRNLKCRNGTLFETALWGFQMDVNTLNFKEIGLMKSIKNS
jgi:KaiC/GvpD/RAD55 family RecA-like ATPase